ncbi:MAG TPA: DUF2508 family protein [Thermoanaerobacterales bacterium]|uniref:DUF2508 family protein n=1 Tax=Tepidanaerobacter sp. GT38 TaxID=2722793 RepID=UPI0017C16CED|nr:DUF2508 family protein [Tepidanaerobacter sp. GT38]MCG1013181.1 DUF2508 family protein [Tepidanaerobacter sp. GT38]HHY41367.1 DUF2508 family protein [Thermoanaerobacterales bacterium]
MKKYDIFRNIYEIFSRFFLDSNYDEPLDTPKSRLADEIREAHQEWIRAQKYFQWVSDPELVDHAIFTEEAARRKYIYLLNQAKNQGISTEELK